MKRDVDSAPESQASEPALDLSMAEWEELSPLQVERLFRPVLEAKAHD